MTQPRLRQLVFACTDLSPAIDLRHLLGLGEPYADPGVAAFGLENAVFALGDQFLEIIAPLPDKEMHETAAGRFLSRGGPGGYMAIFEVEDIGTARQNIDYHGIRRVWNADLDSISASHLHPADTGAAILSIDQPKPAGSWTWGGPAWQKQSRAGALSGAIFSAPQPEELAGKWGRALGLSSDEGTLALKNGQLEYLEGPTERLTGFRLTVEDRNNVLDRARKMQFEIEDGAIQFQGVSLHLD